MNTGKLTYLFRSMGLMSWADKAKFYLYSFKNRAKNKAFRQRHPSVALPPDYMMFEAFKLDYEKYYEGGKVSAQWVCNLFAEHRPLTNLRILDWGCGPARITRHLPTLTQSCQIYGTDYNAQTVAWCQKNIPGITFVKNEIDPPLSFADNTFDLIIGISIFTHLSAANHQEWVLEHYRLLRPQGLILLTTMGSVFKEIMTFAEQQQFDRNELVVRDNVVEGHRTFAAMQPYAYFKELVSPYFDIVSYEVGTRQTWGLAQDTWVLRVKKEW